jgi:hypothetical protein
LHQPNTIREQKLLARSEIWYKQKPLSHAFCLLYLIACIRKRYLNAGNFFCNTNYNFCSLKIQIWDQKLIAKRLQNRHLI